MGVVIISRVTRFFAHLRLGLPQQQQKTLSRVSVCVLSDRYCSVIFILFVGTPDNCTAVDVFGHFYVYISRAWTSALSFPHNLNITFDRAFFTLVSFGFGAFPTECILW